MLTTLSNFEATVDLSRSSIQWSLGQDSEILDKAEVSGRNEKTIWRETVVKEKERKKALSYSMQGSMGCGVIASPLLN